VAELDFCKRNIDIRDIRPAIFQGNGTMTDPTAASNGTDTAATGDNQPAAPDSAALAQEVADTKDRLLRALAEMENLRRRTEREVADARAYGVTSLARDLISVADDLRRALDAAEESAAIVEGPAKALCDGVELIERQLLKVLEKYGIRVFDPQGARFDPNFHQALFEVPDANIPAGSVVQVIQPGFMIGERVLRPAMVGVSKGGPKTAPTESQSSDDETQTG
jgi:molecular chaperone GrpE